jgi:cytochrome c oxidase subunit 3
MSAAQSEPPGITTQTGAALHTRVGNRKLGMWLFILSDSLTFAALLLSYAYLRAASSVWPKPFSFSPEILFATLMMLCLLASSWMMIQAVKASSRGERMKMVRWILATIVAGLAFITLHLIEWGRLIGEGLRPLRVPTAWLAAGAEGASPMFGATFFTITGFHLLHVLSGLIYLAVMAMRRSATHEAVEICGLYWQFVDVVWLIIFPALYLFSMK